MIAIDSKWYLDGEAVFSEVVERLSKRMLLSKLFSSVKVGRCCGGVNYDAELLKLQGSNFVFLREIQLHVQLNFSMSDIAKSKAAQHATYILVQQMVLRSYPRVAQLAMRMGVDAAGVVVGL